MGVAAGPRGGYDEWLQLAPAARSRAEHCGKDTGLRPTTAREAEPRPQEVQLGKAPCDSYAPRAGRRGRQARRRGRLRGRPPAGRHEHDNPEVLPAPKVVPERLDDVRTEVHAEDEGGSASEGCRAVRAST